MRLAPAACLLCACLALTLSGLSAASAQAQTTINLVATTSDTLNSAISTIQAQQFTTGANGGDYLITEVQLSIGAVENRSTEVRLRADNSGNPGSRMATFQNPATVTAFSWNTFTLATGVRLAANTSYWITVNEMTTGSHVVFNGTFLSYAM